MNMIREDADYVTLRLNPVELVGISNSVAVALDFHREELHPLTGLTPEEARALLDELHPIIDRMHAARVKAGLPW